MMEKTALIFGITGQDGAYLAQFLLNNGYIVFGVLREESSSSFLNLKQLGVFEKIYLISANYHDLQSIIKILIKIKPHEIYNLAGQSSVSLSFEQPIETFSSIVMANLTLLEAIHTLREDFRFFYASSSECFGNTSEPATETTPFNPRSPYAIAKASATWQTAMYRESYGIFACSGILSNHESPLRPERFVTQKIVRTAVQIYKKEKTTLRLGNINIFRDWGWAPDFVQAMWLMLQAESPNDYILGTGCTISLGDFLHHVFSYLGLDWREHVHIEHSLFRKSDIYETRLDVHKAALQLGWVANHKFDSVAHQLIQSELNRIDRIHSQK